MSKEYDRMINYIMNSVFPLRVPSLDDEIKVIERQLIRQYKLDEQKDASKIDSYSFEHKFTGGFLNTTIHVTQFAAVQEITIQLIEGKPQILPPP